jgi:hypothetical protein
MPRFKVILTTEKHITLNAIDEDDAQTKAEARVNKNNNKWVAADCYPVAKGK